jgi:hypothetical protein
MITRRSLLPLCLIALVSGCTSGPCVAPTEISEVFSIAADHSCYYKITVTSIDMNNYLVKGKTPAGAPDGPTNSPDFAFRVRDLDKVEKHVQEHIKNQKPLYFIRHGNSPYLELFVEEPIVRK